MKSEVIRKEALPGVKWSGGITTQLVIYPENSSYKKMDFLFRISTAEVTESTSIFTILPDVERRLMILKGHLKICHPHTNSVNLNFLDTYSFSGNWETKSQGLATDFNLMLRENATGSIFGRKFAEGDICKFDFIDNEFVGFYLFKGKITLEKDIVLNEGDFLFISAERDHQTISFKCPESTVVAIARVQK